MSLVMCCFHGSWSYSVDLHHRATLKHGKSCLIGKFPRKLSKTHTFHFHTRPQASLHSPPRVLQIASYQGTTDLILPQNQTTTAAAWQDQKQRVSQGPPSTLLLSSPCFEDRPLIFSHQLISQQTRTYIHYCNPQPFPSFPKYQDAEFSSCLLYHQFAFS